MPVCRHRGKSLACRLTACVVVAAFVAAAGVAPAEDGVDRTGVIFTGDFETRGMAPYGDSRESTFEKVEIVTEPVRSGERALKVTLDRFEHEDLGNHRTDFWLRGMSQSLNQGDEAWYAVSIYVPEDWEPDNRAELWVQWVLGQGAVGEVGGPSLAIYVYGDQYRVRRRWGPGMEAYRNIWLGDVLGDRGRWVDWVFHVRWSPRDDGLIEVWRDGEKIATDRGPNCVEADYAPYFKFGIYKWPWASSPEETPSTVTRREIFFDEIRIADDRGSFEAVSPD